MHSAPRHLMFAAALLLPPLAMAQAASPWPDAYARREYRLGISIGDFKSTPHPDPKDWPGAFPVCTGDPEAGTYPFQTELDLPPAWQAAGVLKCMHFFKSGPSTFTAGVKMGDMNVETIFYFIPQEIGGEPRLFQVLTGGPTAAYPELVAVFTSALGKPTTARKEPIQTRAGATFENEITEWRNRSSRVEVRRFGSTTRLLQVRHTLDALMTVLDQRLAAGNVEKAKKL